ncbi:MAG: DNRLRE domain-containing protein, partial [Candidatus Omnitrophica bacterium]|nr:DNRLRE domain-containing protein [Candidatus Omnitrophota bacterium]
GVVMALPNSANAMILYTDFGNGADSYIRSNFSDNGEADINHGSEPLTWIKHDLGLNGNNRKSYLRFDLSGITDPVTDISFEISYAGTDGSGANSNPPASPSTYNVYGLNDGVAGESWNESTITWNNAPGNDIASAGGLIGSATTLLGSFDLTFPPTVDGTRISLNTAALLGFFASDTDDLLTLILTRQQQNTSVEYFAAKEDPNRVAPALNITTQMIEPPTGVVPEPATILLFGGGMVGAIMRRKIKA